MDFDELLSSIGGGGRVKHLITFTCFYCFALGSLHVYTQMFTQGDDNYRCYVPSCDYNSSVYEASWLNFTTPMVHDKKTDSEIRSRCTFFNYNQSTPEDTCSPFSFDSSSTQKCDKFVFESPYKTLNKKWNLVCDKKYLLSFSMSIFLGGFLCGVFVFGIISDRLGRKVAIFAAFTLLLTTSIISIFSQDYYMFVVLRFFTGMAVIGLSTTQFVLLSEICGTKNRSLVIATALGSDVGLFLIIGLAYQYRSWFELQTAVTICSGILIVALWFTPESPRWLLSKRRNDKAFIILNKIAKWNNKSLCQRITEGFDNKYDEDRKKSEIGLLLLFKFSKIRKRFFIMAFVWICDSLIGYGLCLGTKNMSGNLYINFSLIAVGSTIGWVFGYFTVKYIRRRLSLSLCFLLLFILSLVNSFLTPEYSTVSAVLAMASTAFINTAFNITYIYTVELFPTPIRSTAMGTGSMVSRIGGMAAPFVIEAIYVWRPLPFLIYGVFSIICCIAIMFLPETIDKMLPTTIEEIEKPGLLLQADSYSSVES